MGMMKASDIVMSKGVKRASDEDELSRRQSVFVYKIEHLPHANIVLHHEFMNGLGGVCHVNFAISVSEIRLKRINKGFTVKSNSSPPFQ